MHTHAHMHLLRSTRARTHTHTHTHTHTSACKYYKHTLETFTNISSWLFAVGWEEVYVAVVECEC